MGRAVLILTIFSRVCRSVFCSCVIVPYQLINGISLIVYVVTNPLFNQHQIN